MTTERKPRKRRRCRWWRGICKIDDGRRNHQLRSSNFGLRRCFRSWLGSCVPESEKGRNKFGDEVGRFAPHPRVSLLKHPNPRPHSIKIPKTGPHALKCPQQPKNSLYNIKNLTSHSINWLMVLPSCLRNMRFTSTTKLVVGHQFWRSTLTIVVAFQIVLSVTEGASMPRESHSMNTRMSGCMVSIWVYEISKILL